MKLEGKLINAPPDWWEAFARAAESHGENLSEFARKSMLLRLSKSQRSALSELRSPGRPKED